MKYLKTFEANSHWTESLYDKVKFDKIDEIKDLTFPFLDEFEMVSDVSYSFKKNGFDSPSRIQDYLSDNTNLYKAYYVQIHHRNIFNILDIDKLLLFKDLEIEIINRLRDMGYIFKYSTPGYDSSSNNVNYISIELYHKDDIVDKSLFLEDYSNKDIKSKDELFKFLQDKFGKISNIWMSASKNIIIDVDPFDKYTIDDLYNFVTKTLGDKYLVTKISNDQNDESRLSLKIGYK